ncbi:hypothetical protein [Haloarcula sp. H-GB5]|jgi:hypothetical protein
MSPTPEYQPGIPNKIVATVKEMRDALITRKLGEDCSPSDNRRVLDGYCHENAYHIAKILLERGYEPYVVWGAVSATQGHSLKIDTIDQLEQTDRIHFWVEIHPRSVDEADHPIDEITSPVIIDLCSETIGHVNCPYVSLQRPARYQRMGVDPSYIRFERSFEPEDLISKESYQRLRERSPELFSTCPWANDEPTACTDVDEQRHKRNSLDTQ